LNTLLIAFDPQRLRSRTLRAMIENSFPDCWHRLEGAYIVSTALAATQLRDMLKLSLADTDELLVVTLQASGWAWTGNSADGVDWLRHHA
jgi:hypothetical protein